MSCYAKGTSVSTARSRAEIESTVQRYGADGFMSGWVGDRATVGFQVGARQVRVELRLPHPSDPRLESGISTFDEEFLAWLVIPGGHGETVGQRVLSGGKLSDDGKVPHLLGKGGAR